MDKQTVKDLMYGGITGLISNRRYYYHSAAGPQYSYWTTEGQAALVEYITLLSGMIIESDEVELNQRAKNLVIKGLKGETI
jgi:hypothetical protein